MEYVLILLVNLVHLSVIKYGLVFDDAMTMVTQPFPIKTIKTVSVLLHIAVAEFIYIAFGSNPVSLVAAILFSVHPIGVQVSTLWAGSHYGLNALIMMGILAFQPLGILFYLVGVRANATLVFTPLVFMFTQYWPIALLTPVLFFVYWQDIKKNLKTKIEGNGPFVPAVSKTSESLVVRPRKVVIMVKTFGYYALSCLLPVKNGIYNSFLQTFGISGKTTKYWYSLNRHFWGGLLAIGLMGYVWFIHRSDYIGMGIVLFVTSIAPFMNFISCQQFTSPRYGYLALIGFQIALVGLLSTLGPLALFIYGALFLFYLDRLLRVRKHYQFSNIEMYELEREVFPDNPRIWYFLYEHFLHKKAAEMSFCYAFMGIKHLPEDCQLWFGLSVAAFTMGDAKAASMFLDTCEKLEIQTEREQMKGLIAEFRERIRHKMGLTGTHIPQKQPFYRGVA